MIVRSAVDGFCHDVPTDAVVGVRKQSCGGRLWVKIVFEDNAALDLPFEDLERRDRVFDALGDALQDYARLRDGELVVISAEGL